MYQYIYNELKDEINILFPEKDISTVPQDKILENLWNSFLNLSVRVSCRKEICSGEPTITGTRITVEFLINIFKVHKQNSMEEIVTYILGNYPSISKDDILAALVWYLLNNKER